MLRAAKPPISALSAAAARRLRFETRLRAQSAKVFACGENACTAHKRRRPEGRFWVSWTKCPLSRPCGTAWKGRIKHDEIGGTVMAHVVEITDIAAPELRPYTQLTHAQLRRRREPEEGLFIAESAKVISCALDAGCCPLSFLMERRHLPAFLEHLGDQCGDVPIYIGDREVLSHLTGYELTRGMLSAMHRPALPGVEELCRKARRVVVLENITDATNVGAIFRCAAALGMDGVLVTPSCCDPLYRRAVRVSMGTVFQIPWTWMGSDSSQWPQPGLSRLRSLGFKTVAMALSDRSVPIDDPALAGEEKLAIVLGSEGDGLSPHTIAACDYTARIPMSHGVDSLNVAAAGAVIFWQLRPRHS